MKQQRIQSLNSGTEDNSLQQIQQRQTPHGTQNGQQSQGIPTIPIHATVRSMSNAAPSNDMQNQSTIESLNNKVCLLIDITLIETCPLLPHIPPTNNCLLLNTFIRANLENLLNLT